MSNYSEQVEALAAETVKALNSCENDCKQKKERWVENAADK